MYPIFLPIGPEAVHNVAVHYIFPIGEFLHRFLMF